MDGDYRLKLGSDCGKGLGFFYGGGRARWLGIFMMVEEVGSWALVNLVGFDCDS